MSFYFFSFVCFCHNEYCLALEVVLGLAFSITDIAYVSGHRVFGNKSRPSQMNLCKWLFDNEASLICQLCLFKQTLPCRATQSLESADSTGEIFSITDGTQDGLLFFVFFRVECIIQTCQSGRLLLWFSCVKCSFVWFCLCCFLCLQWSKDRPLFEPCSLIKWFPLSTATSV